MAKNQGGKLIIDEDVLYNILDQANDIRGVMSLVNSCTFFQEAFAKWIAMTLDKFHFTTDPKYRNEFIQFRDDLTSGQRKFFYQYHGGILQLPPKIKVSEVVDFSSEFGRRICVSYDGTQILCKS